MCRSNILYIIQVHIERRGIPCFESRGNYKPFRVIERSESNSILLPLNNSANRNDLQRFRQQCQAKRNHKGSIKRQGNKQGN